MARPLVIFDCDGTLIDSERIAVGVEVRMLADLGWPLTEDEVIERFVGGSADGMVRAVEAHLGRPLPDDWHAPYQGAYEAAFREHLRAHDGVAEALDAIAHPTCVASNSRRHMLHRKLRHVGLWHHFEGRVFSVDDVDRPKPHPDLFLHAAAELGHEPAECIVVEDSPAGVEAARAAGMEVLAFGGTIVPRHRFPANVTWFAHMRDLPALLVG